MRSRWVSSRWLGWLRWLHLLAGLQSAVALVVYGVAGLAATWQARPEAPAAARRVEVRSYVPRDGESDVALALRLHHELALSLTRPPPDWVVQRAADGALTFRLYSPNGMQHLRVPQPGRVEIADERVDLARFLLNLHAHTVPRPGSNEDLRLVLWSIYNELSMLALGGFAASGLVLWLATRPRAVLPWTAFLAACAGCGWITWSSW